MRGILVSTLSLTTRLKLITEDHLGAQHPCVHLPYPQYTNTAASLRSLHSAYRRFIRFTTSSCDYVCSARFCLTAAHGFTSFSFFASLDISGAYVTNLSMGRDLNA